MSSSSSTDTRDNTFRFDTRWNIAGAFFVVCTFHELNGFSRVATTEGRKQQGKEKKRDGKRDEDQPVDQNVSTDSNKFACWLETREKVYCGKQINARRRCATDLCSGSNQVCAGAEKKGDR